MIITDSHCHIHQADYPLDTADVEQHAAEAGVTRMICVGTDAQTSQQAIDYVAAREGHWAAIGIHPHEANGGEKEYSKLQKLLRKDSKIVAIGECGLDYFYNHSTPAQQEAALRFQVEVAIAHDLPIIFHVREAYDDFWRIMTDYPQARGVLHSFTDNLDNLNRAIERGFYVGLNGIMTFTKNDWQLEVARQVPDHLLLIETDAPFLTPKPFRGKINEPANVRLVAEFLAELREQSLENIANTTTQNAAKLFNLN